MRRAGFLAAGFLGPDALLERAARRRRRRFVAALPDALDMLAVGAASGRDPATVLGEIAGGTSGPLAVELARTVAEIECGRPLRERSRARAPGSRAPRSAPSRRRSSARAPTARRSPSSSTSRRPRCAATPVAGLGGRAARAAPKIQLVVALVLVPSVLLMIIAAIVAHSDALLGSI